MLLYHKIHATLLSVIKAFFPSGVNEAAEASITHLETESREMGKSSHGNTLKAFTTGLTKIHDTLRILAVPDRLVSSQSP